MFYLGPDYHKRYSFATIIDGEGNKIINMIEAIIPATRSNTDIHQFYNRIKQRKGSKAAKVATARRLLTIIYRVLKQKDTFKNLKKIFTVIMQISRSRLLIFFV